MTASPIVPCAASDDKYYSNKTFYRMLPVAGIYTAVAHLAVLLMKPFPFHIKANSVDAILPEHRFSTAESSVAIVTGSNTGIGFETASSLVEQGYTVILACRSRDKGQSSADLINNNLSGARDKSFGKATFLHPLDLSSLKSVRSFSEAFCEKYSHLNILVNNAGINTSGTSEDGMDLCFQTNFVGHYLLTRLLVPNLLNAKNFFGNEDKKDVEAGRVVNLSSATHHFAGCNEPRNGGDKYLNKTGKHDKQWWRDTATPDVSDNTYKESKLAAILFSRALNNRFGNAGLKAVTANPGAVNSDIWRNYPKYMDKIHETIYLTRKQGAATSIAGAISKLPENDLYLQPYWQPFKNIRSKMSTLVAYPAFGNKWYSKPLPFAEMLGPCVGFAITEPRLPADVNASADALWEVCGDLTGL